MLLQIDGFERRRAVMAGRGGHDGAIERGHVSHTASPNASTRPNGLAASVHRGEIAPGTVRRQTGNAARTDSPAAGWSARAPPRGSPAADRPARPLPRRL